MALVLTALAAAEMLIPELRVASEDISMRLYERKDMDSTVLGSGERFLKIQAQRDEQEHGGLPRPLLGSVEPGRVAILLGLLLTGYNLSRIKTSRSTTLFVFLTCAAMVITRSPTFLFVILAGNISFPSRVFSLTGPSGILYAMLLAGGILATGALISVRLANLSEMEDSSVNERIALPWAFMKVALSETYGMGVGFIGEIVEPGNRALDQFVPLYTETLKKAGLDATFHQYLQGRTMALGHFTFLTHWAFYGLPLGLLAMVIWGYFAKSCGPNLVLPFFLCFILIGWVGYYYQWTMFWVLLMTVFSFVTGAQLEQEQDYIDER